MTELRTLYPDIEPYDAGRLKVSEVTSFTMSRWGTRMANPRCFFMADRVVD